MTHPADDPVSVKVARRAKVSADFAIMRLGLDGPVSAQTKENLRVFYRAEAEGFYGVAG